MNLKESITYIKDFPAAGITFRDLNPLWQEKEFFHFMIEELAKKIKPFHPTQLVALEARGFLIASALAYSLGLGVSLIRKKGKLPGEVFKAGYKNEYTFTGDIEIQKNSLKKGARVILVDDILATGKSTLSCLEVLRMFKEVEVVASAYVLEIVELKGRESISPLVPVITLIKD